MRKIIHIDMDCFFAAVEIRDNPKLRGKPVAVGGAKENRGVIATASYEARKFGVHSALSSAEALRRCPNLILIKPNGEKYKAASQEIFTIFNELSDVVEPISIDEAFIDYTFPKKFFESATKAAKYVREEIFKKTKLTASAGIAPNPFLAKVASDLKKPNGQVTITPEIIPDFIFSLPLRKVPGVGKVSEQKLLSMGFKTCGDLQALEKFEMHARFGKWGARLYDLCRGVDDRVIGLKRERKSVSVERTFAKDLPTLTDCEKQLSDLLMRLFHRLEKIPLEKIKNLFVKIKFADFQTTTLEDASVKDLCLNSFKTLLKRACERSEKTVRLIGLGVRLKVEGKGPKQLELFTV